MLHEHTAFLVTLSYKANLQPSSHTPKLLFIKSSLLSDKIISTPLSESVI